MTTSFITAIPEGFTPHDGSWAEVRGNQIVEIIKRTGVRETGRADRFNWTHDFSCDLRDIVGYRVIDDA